MTSVKKMNLRKSDVFVSQQRLYTAAKGKKCALFHKSMKIPLSSTLIHIMLGTHRYRHVRAVILNLKWSQLEFYLLGYLSV